MNHILEGTYDFETVRVGSADELTTLLEKVASLPRPTWLELAKTDGDALLVGLGREFSSLRFIKGDDNGEVYHSDGTLASPQDSDFDFGTVPTTMDTGSAIPVTDALAAAVEFQATGQRPTNVAWNAVEVPDVEPDPVEGWDAFASDAESN